MDENLPDERPQRRREYSGPAATFGLAALVIAVVALGVWYFEIRADGGGAEREPGLGIVALDDALNPTDRAPAAKVGRAAPSFRLRNIDGSITTLADLRGRYVLVNFWASWCPPCRGETPDLQAFHEARAPGLVVVGVNQQESLQTASAFVQQFEVTYPVVLDVDGQVSDAYHVGTGLPISFVVDPEGVIQRVLFGRITREDLAELAAEFRF